MSDVTLGALVGILATLIGVWVTYRLTEAHDAKKAVAEDRELLRLLTLDLKNQKIRLALDAPREPLDLAVLELLPTRGILARLAPAAAAQILRTYDALRHVNASIDSMKTAVRAFIQSGAPDRWHLGMDDMKSEIDNARRAADHEIDTCLAAIDEHF